MFPLLPPNELRRSPLVPVAAAFTAGLLVDHFWLLPWAIIAVAAVAGMAVWWSGRTQAGLLVWVAAVGAGDHHLALHSVAVDDVSHLVGDGQQLVRVRGVLVDEPITSPAPPADPLRSTPASALSRATLQVELVAQGMGFVPASGRVAVRVPGEWPACHTGDRLELLGWLRPLPEPLNPGEADLRPAYHGRGVRALLSVHGSGEAIVVWDDAAPLAPGGVLARVRGWGQRAIAERFPADVAPLAAALLLGDGAPLQRDDWDRYIRTGVVHVLAISGQHLAVLAAFLIAAAWLGGLHRRTTALSIAAFMAFYAALTGAHPPVVRSAVGVLAVAGAVVLKRRIVPANLFALGWLAIVAWNSADAVDSGCLLSFVSVLTLAYVVRPWLRPTPLDPLDAWLREREPWPVKLLRLAWAGVRDAYLVSGIVGLAVLPLVAERYHLISPAGCLIGPPVSLLASLALVLGFLFLVVHLIVPPLAGPFAWLAGLALRGSDTIVRAADGFAGSHLYWPDLPTGWAAAGFALVAAWWLVGRWPRGFAVAGMVWLIVGLLLTGRGTGDELRITFLAVGHGGCAVLEPPDGRVILYDAGSLAGPDVTPRVIAPYLWGRGVHRIDEVLLSHADLDHFNALPGLLRRFAVGQITCTPTFADKRSPGVRELLADYRRRGIEPRITQAGDRWAAGGGVTVDVLHPPAEGPAGNENARSLVLRVTHAGHSLLFTGDLEGAGQALLLATLAPAVDVLMAPHHGSLTARPEAVVAWCRPRACIACSGPAKAGEREPKRPDVGAALWLATGESGAVVVRSRPGALTVETFRPAQRIVLKAGR